MNETSYLKQTKVEKNTEKEGRQPRLTKCILAVCSLLFFFCFRVQAQIEWPSVSETNKPWTRWWWQGSAVNKKDLKWNLEQYRTAGLGGVELTPIYGIHGQEDQFIEYLSPEWMEVFQFTLDEAEKLGLGVDLANATGWPFGGPWVKPEDASKSIFYKTFRLKEGEKLRELVEYQREGFVRTANHTHLTPNDVKRPLSANRDMQSLSLDQLVYPENVSPLVVMAYGEKGEVLDLTEKINGEGLLDWTAPEGTWELYALFTGLHGKMVERAAPGGEGYAIDHFSGKAVDAYFKRFDDAFKDKNLSKLRAFFNDSYEVDDAKGNADWTPGFFKEFEERRGYDLKEHLPELFGENPDPSGRILYDYRTTIDELLLEHFTTKWKDWAHRQGMLIRNQAHGSPANILDLYETVDIPETEGTDILQFKFASSAGNVGGKPLISSESATWLKEHFLSSLGDVKELVDKYFLGGVNHIFYHGTAYSPQNAPWPGWLFYAAVHFQPTHPQWDHFKTLNGYITKVQSFLQNGQSDNDVLVYYPLPDIYTKRTPELLQHFSGMDDNFKQSDFEVLSEELLQKGYSFDFFSDWQLARFTFEKERIKVEENTYRTILLPAHTFIPLETFEKLLELAEDGALILAHKALPEDIPGKAGLNQKKTTFHELLSGLSFQEKGNLRYASLGKGAILVGDEVEDLLRAASVEKEGLTERGLQYIRRKNEDGKTYFVKNASDKPLDEKVILNTPGTAVALFDPMKQELGLAEWEEAPQGVKVRLQMDPGASIIVRIYKEQKTGEPFRYWKPAQNIFPVGEEWTVKFLSGGPVLPESVKVDSLISWTEFLGEHYDSFSGIAEYQTTFEKPSGEAAFYVLDLGEVYHSAEVVLNGKRLGTLIDSPFKIILPAADLKKENTLEIKVANPMANRIRYMDKNQLPWKIFYDINMAARERENTKEGIFDASQWEPLPSGLLGPVVLTPLKED